MTDQEILGGVTRIVRDLVGDDTVVLTPETTGADVPNWDSATYVNFIVAAEIEFGIKFPLAEIEEYRTFGDIVRGISGWLCCGGTVAPGKGPAPPPMKYALMNVRAMLRKSIPCCSIAVRLISATVTSSTT